MENWNCDEVCQWLESIPKFKEESSKLYIDLFRKEHIDGENLHKIKTVEQFIDLVGDGKIPRGHLDTILKKMALTIQDNDYIGNSQCRKFGQKYENITYKIYSKLINSDGNNLEESGPSDDDIVTLKPYVEFKRYENLTKSEDIESMSNKALIFAAGILNRRSNGIIYFGINNEGKIIEGCKLSENKNDDIGNKKETITTRFHQVLKKVFKANTDILTAAENCISSPKFIRIAESTKNTDKFDFINNIYVIEVEVESKMDYIKHQMFFEIPDNKNMKEKKFYVRKGASNSPLKGDELKKYKDRLKFTSEKRIKKDEKKKARLQMDYKLKYRELGKKLKLFLEKKEPNNRILIVDKVNKKDFTFINCIKWKMVLDLNSDASLCDAFKNENSLHLQIIIDLLGDKIEYIKKPEFNSWIFVNGYTAQNISVFKYDEWVEKRSHLVRSLLSSISYLMNEETTVVFLINEDEEGILSQIYCNFSSFMNELYSFFYIARNESKLIKLKAKMADKLDFIDEESHGIVGLSWKDVGHVFKLISGKYDTERLIPLSSSVYSPINTRELTDLVILNPDKYSILFKDMIRERDSHNYQNVYNIIERLVNIDIINRVNLPPKYKEYIDRIRQKKDLVDSDNKNRTVRLLSSDSQSAKILTKNVLLNFRENTKCATIDKVTNNTVI